VRILLRFATPQHAPQFLQSAPATSTEASAVTRGAGILAAARAGGLRAL